MIPRQNSTAPLDVFISHSSQDRNVANAACAMLEQHGLRCWIAPRDIHPGENWGDAIMRGLDLCRCMVVIFSVHANESNYVKREVERAVAKGSLIIPLRIEDVNPRGAMALFASSLHWLDAFPPPLELHLKQLAGTLTQWLGRPSQIYHEEPRPSAPASVPAAAFAPGPPQSHHAVPPPIPVHKESGGIRDTMDEAGKFWEQSPHFRNGVYWTMGVTGVAGLLGLMTGSSFLPYWVLGTCATLSAFPLLWLFLGLLVRMFRHDGIGTGLLGLFCFVYALVWGLQKSDVYGLKQRMKWIFIFWGYFALTGFAADTVQVHGRRTRSAAAKPAETFQLETPASVDTDFLA